MPVFRTGRSSALLGLTALLAIAFSLAYATTTQAQVLSDPRIAEFDPSPDHWAVLADGNPAVLRYELSVYLVGASEPLAIADMGKPAPEPDGKIRYDFSAQVAAWSLPGGYYDARVSAVGPEGSALSEPSNPFAFTSAPTSAISYPLTVSTTGSGTGSGAQVVNDPNVVHMFDVAFDATRQQYLVVWNTWGQQIKGQFLGAQGQALGSAIAIGSGIAPRVAYGATSQAYLVTYTAGSTRWARAVTPATGGTATLGTAMSLGNLVWVAGHGNLGSSAWVASSNTFLATWWDGGANILVRGVGPGGTTGAATVLAASDTQELPEIACGPTACLVVGQTWSQAIWGRWLDPAGASPSARFTIEQGTGAREMARVAYSETAGTFTVVWTRDGIPQTTTLTPGGTTGTPIRPVVTGQVGTQLGWAYNSTLNGFALAAQGNASAVWAHGVEATGTPQTGAMLAVSDVATTDGRPVVAANPLAGQFLVVYRPTLQTLRTRLLGSSAPPASLLTVSTTGTGSGTVTSSPAGITCGSDCSESYASGTVVTLTAMPASGTQFMGWASGDADCADGTVTMFAAHSCVAVFNLTPTVSLNPTTVTASASGGNYAASVSTCAGCSWAATTALPWVALGTKGGSGSGTVLFAVQANSSKSGRTGTIDIGGQSLTVWQDGLATPVISWAMPEPITVGTALSSAQLNATANVPGSFVYSPSAGFVFPAGQSTLKASFTPSDPTYSTATAYVNLTVTAATYQLTVARPAGGTVTGGGLTCGTSGTICQVTAAANSSIGLTAAPESGNTFAGWTGDCAGTTSSFTVVLSGPKSCGATFLPPAPVPPSTDGSLPLGPPYTLTIVRPSGGVVRGPGINCGTNPKDCEVTEPVPMTIALQATPDSGYIFLAGLGLARGAVLPTCCPSKGRARAVRRSARPPKAEGRSKRETGPGLVSLVPFLYILPIQYVIHWLPRVRTRCPCSPAKRGCCRCRPASRRRSVEEFAC